MTQLYKESSHIPILDSLRSIAALSVCLFHFVCTTTGYIQSKWVLTFFSIGKYGVQLFFVISGFVIPWAMYHSNFQFKDFFKFLLKRLARLEPPYVVSLIIALSILFLRERLLGLKNDHLEISISQVFLHFGYLIPFFEGYKWLNQVYWTLAIEFQYYFFMAIVFVLLVKSNLIMRIVFYLIMIGAGFISKEDFLPYWLPIFLIGILLFLYKAQCVLKLEYILATIIVFVVCFFKYPLVSMLYIIMPVIAILFFSKFRISIFHFLGKMSYSIYLIHPLIGASLINILSHSMSALYEKIIVIFLGTLVTILSSWIMYVVIENPSKKLSGSIRY